VSRIDTQEQAKQWLEWVQSCVLKARSNITEGLFGMRETRKWESNLLSTLHPHLFHREDEMDMYSMAEHYLAKKVLTRGDLMTYISYINLRAPELKIMMAAWEVPFFEPLEFMQDSKLPMMEDEVIRTTK